MQQDTQPKQRTFWGKLSLILFFAFCFYAAWGTVKMISLFVTFHPAPEVATATYVGEFVGVLIGFTFYVVIGAPLGYLAWRTRAK